MAYMVNYGHFLSPTVYETYDDLIYHFWYEIADGRFDRFTIIDTYDRQPIDKEHFLNYAWNKYYARRKENYHRRLGNYEFRREPIRGTGKRKRAGYRYYRHPKTLNELKALSGVKADEELREYKIKHGRCKADIPTSWDDLGRRNINDRSWKNFRKHQWKD